jgi:hypothetical protein
MLRSSRLKQINFEKIDRRYLHWLFEAKKRFGLSVLNYMITSNHVQRAPGSGLAIQHSRL